MFAVAQLIAFDGTDATLAVPNDVHRQKCEQRKADVETALNRHTGPGIGLTLVVDENATARDRGGAVPSRPSTAEDDYDLGEVDVHDLTDAPDAATGGIDALTEAFPGAEFVED